MRNRARKNYVIYVLMLLLFGGLIYVAIEEGDRFSHYAVNAQNMVQGNPFTMFLQFIQDNLHHPLTTLLIQIIAVLLMVRLFGYLFSLIGQPERKSRVRKVLTQYRQQSLQSLPVARSD